MKIFNPIIKTLIISDLFVMVGFGLIQPIIAVYVNDSIIGGSIFVVGIASSIFLITKSLVQIPFSHLVDKYDDQNDLKWLIVGSVLVTITPLIYYFATNVYHYYFAQLIFGIGSGMTFPAWLGLWSTHLDKNRESFEWSFYSSLTGMGAAFAAALGGIIAETIGFQPTFLVVALLMLLSCLTLIWLKRHFGRIAAADVSLPRTAIDVPDLRQTGDFDCGITATETVLAHFGLDVRSDVIMRQTGATVEKGTSVQGIADCLITNGLKCQAGPMTLDEVKDYVRRGLPVILAIQAWSERPNTDWKNDWEDGHYVVAIGFDDFNVYFEDPSAIKRTYLSFEELAERWHDVDDDGRKFFSYAIVAYAKDKDYDNAQCIHME